MVSNLQYRVDDLPSKTKNHVKGMLAQKKSILQKIPEDSKERVKVDWHTSKSSYAPWLFYSILLIVYVLNILIIDSKLNNWCFGLSTTMISVKLFATYC